MVLPDLFLDHDSPARMYAQAGLDAGAIASTALSALGVAAIDRAGLA